VKEEYVRIIFGLKTKLLRQQKNLSLQDLALKTGISASYLNEIEKSKKYPKATKIFKLADALEVDYDYLVSLQLDAKMKPIADLLHSEILSELPLELFGIDVPTFIELLSSAPSKLNAFIVTLMDISRAYGITKEEFLLSSLRAYQEMHNNYFPELEKMVLQFKKENDVPQTFTSEKLKAILEERFNYQIELYDFSQEESLKGTRTILFPGMEKSKLLISPKLSENQKLFAYGRELGYAYLGLYKRPYSSSWVSVDSFEEVLNHFKASYFSCALLIPEKEVIQDLQEFINQPVLEPELLLGLIEKYRVTPETLVYRITNVLPKHFNLGELFFLRITKDTAKGKISLDKELHLSGIHHPHGVKSQQNYCRRWVSSTIMEDFDRQDQIRLGKAQYSFYPDGQSYFVFAIAYQAGNDANKKVSISLGLKVNQQFKRKIKFLNDQKIAMKYVGTTCEWCPIANCEVRVAPPVELENKLRQEEKLLQINKLRDTYF
jgi:XRE family transcriptional regulator, fatty acid utilization regulator